MQACGRGHEQCALALIKAGAAVDKQRPQEATALIIACQNGHEQCALALLKAGAAVDAQSNEGTRADAGVPERSRAVRSRTAQGGG